MKKAYLIAAVLCASPPSFAQPGQTSSATDASPKVTTCLRGSEMRTVFAAGDTAGLPSYTEAAGARVQRQHPNTRLIGQAKHLQQADGKALGICEYSNHVGIVAVFLLGDAKADAYDEACDNGTCSEGDYWRSEHMQTPDGSERENPAMIKACYRDIDNTAYPSSRCGFTRAAR